MCLLFRGLACKVARDMAKDWKTEERTGRQLVDEWVEAQGSIAEAARMLGLGPSGRQRLWAYLRVGTGLGRRDELRAAIISGIPYRAVVNADDPVCDLFNPRLADLYVGEELDEHGG